MGPDPASPPLGAISAGARAARTAAPIGAAAAAGIATALWQGLELTHGIWLAISASVVLQPRTDQTWAKGVNRVVGTLIGAAVATACAAVLPANAFTVAGAVAVTILLCWSSGRLHDPMLPRHRRSPAADGGALTPSSLQKAKIQRTSDFGCSVNFCASPEKGLYFGYLLMVSTPDDVFLISRRRMTPVERYLKPPAIASHPVPDGIVNSSCDAVAPEMR